MMHDHLVLQTLEEKKMYMKGGVYEHNLELV